ncbi:MAG: spondin domain-containing protein [Pseudomonadales bacterium]|nr:spondin domain-containing protein [Pseudomonadales bacterium]
MSLFNKSLFNLELRGKMITVAMGSSLLLAGCGGSSSDNNTADNTEDLRSFEISVHNVTANQPFSPIAVILHSTGYQAWIDGEAASTALELLAEEGDNSSLLTEASLHDAYLASQTGTGVIGPGQNESVQFEVDAQNGVSVSVVSMLVNTNDAYTGINAAALTALNTGESMSVKAPVWDAGTESNTEAAGTIPGPADNAGEGFNAERSDQSDRIRFHSGVVSSDDGLSTSVLSAEHRFDNPSAMITITRLN